MKAGLVPFSTQIFAKEGEATGGKNSSLLPVIETFPVDIGYLDAAREAVRQGAMRLAAEELARIRPALQNDPPVLQVKWLLHAAAGKWDICLSLARILVAERPANGACWVALGKSLLRVKRYTEAQTILDRVAPQFPDQPALRKLAQLAAEHIDGQQPKCAGA